MNAMRAIVAASIIGLGMWSWVFALVQLARSLA